MSTALLRDLDARIPNSSAESPRTSPCHPRGRQPEAGERWGGRAEPGQCGGLGVPRQSASEREKLRMRRLAQALLRLRHYLPPTLAPAGQSLTKIETLRLATRYIAHLSALLGLSEEVLTRRRGTSPRHCPLCPQGLGCCQSPAPRLCPPAPLDALSPGSVGWGSPTVAGTTPELHPAPDVGTGSWAFPSCVPAAGNPQEVLGVPDIGMETWGSPHYIPMTETSLELHHLPSSISGSWASPLHLRAVTPPAPPERGIMAMGTWTTSSCCLQPAAPSESPQAELTDTGPPRTPACGSRLPGPHQLHPGTALGGLKLISQPQSQNVVK
ncbi:mesoderm posterior protein 1-like [Indicator indicator]|uniref:mesoderm posterior protein 1-like n=1 Tax=Indicator indicator TaxID=1002788 RepID=UPI0023DFFB87|nr:mesoderm posterior protein 1-like [Indicator indicator]